MTVDVHMKSPYPWFGGKSRVAALVWERFGRVQNYVEPFFGSGAMLLLRPQVEGIETVNDLDGFVANFWRALRAAPDEVAEHADWPVNENDLHARHAWLLGQRDTLQARLEGHPDFYDARIAGWWVWGLCCWIGSGWCSGRGPWVVRDGELVRLQDGDAGQGVNRKRPHLGNFQGNGVVAANRTGGLQAWFQALSRRMERVRVCSGDWSRVCGPSVTHKHGLTAVFLDPPYADTAARCADLYREDSLQVAHQVREWAIEAGARPDMRIALCCYEGEHVLPAGWECVEWKAKGGYESQADEEERSGNSGRERVWFSPHCLSGRQGTLW